MSKTNSMDGKGWTIEVCGFRIDHRINGNDSVVTVEHDEAESEECDHVAQCYIRMYRDEFLRSELISYIAFRDKLPDILEAPRITMVRPELERITAWLAKNPDFIPLVADALKDHGFGKKG